MKMRSTYLVPSLLQTRRIPFGHNLVICRTSPSCRDPKGLNILVVWFAIATPMNMKIKMMKNENTVSESIKLVLVLLVRDLVRMVPSRQVEISLLDLLEGCGLLDSQQLIVVLLLSRGGRIGAARQHAQQHQTRHAQQHQQERKRQRRHPPRGSSWTSSSLVSPHSNQSPTDSDRKKTNRKTPSQSVLHGAYL